MRTSHFKQILIAAIILLGFIPAVTNTGDVFAQGVTDVQVQELLERMTPEEKVGQLFLVTFQGTNVGSDTQIYNLINEHYIGGVILLAENDNFTDSYNNLNELWSLINQLQVSRYSTSQNNLNTLEQEVLPPPIYVPLLIGTYQEGDGYPNDQIINGLTPLPSLLSIGATWKTDLAKQIGEIAGKELSDLGFNLFFGPSLNIIENPLLQGASQLGNRSFGGNPYWVGEMGRAYIQGLHEGSEGQMVVAATNFPGLGSADHLPDQEVATVQKSLEQLKQIELAPFFVVTGNAISNTQQVDALLTSHIRYQGLQGNIRSTTRPIGFDQQALNLLMDLPELSSWRDRGGVMISDDLGSRAVRRFYDPTEQEFNARRLALDAFLAGNDLLYINNFKEPADPDTYTTIIRTLEFFTQKYLEDPLFAERVDQSVTRILSLKYRLYNQFDLEQVQKTGNIRQIGTSSQVTYDVARQGVVLISPSLKELETVLPEIPGRNDFVVYITDDYSVNQCSQCSSQSTLPVDTLAKAVINLYGPQSGGLVSQFYQRSYSFSQLIDLLDDIGETDALRNDIDRTTWIVFVMQDLIAERPHSIAIKRFLAEKPELFSEKRVVVFATNAPNYLDSTDISKLTAYIGLSSRSSPFIDIAARVLFKEIVIPPGSLPVSVPGVGYDLTLATSPNPNQVISLEFEISKDSDMVETPESENNPIPILNLGETLKMTTGKILDSNNHPVPDNTSVEFTYTLNGEPIPTFSTLTRNGIAQAEFTAGQSGTLAVQIICGLASSEILVFEIPRDENELEPTSTSTPTEVPTLEPTSTSFPPTPVPTVEPEQEDTEIGVEYWLGALSISLLVGWFATRIGAILGKGRWGIQWGLSSIIGGLLLYTYYVLNLPGKELISSLSEDWGFLIASIIGSLVGWSSALLITSFNFLPTTLKRKT
jgi:beta-N-acetylhexosaminidase